MYVYIYIHIYIHTYDLLPHPDKARVLARRAVASRLGVKGGWGWGGG